MRNNVSQASFSIIKKMQQNELTESCIYEEIAKFAKGEENKATLLRLAREEKAHYEIWKKYTKLDMKPEKMKVLRYKLLARILGFTFVSPCFIFYLVKSAYSARAALHRSSGFSSICSPILPPLTMIAGCALAETSTLVTYCFFMPTAVQPPLI